MAAGGGEQVRSGAELSVGDQIEAWHNGKLFHRGEVTKTVAGTDLFWILDQGTGARRLIDAEALMIVRGTAPVPDREPAPEAGVPASYVPLFQSAGPGPQAGENGTGAAG